MEYSSDTTFIVAKSIVDVFTFCIEIRYFSFLFGAYAND